MAVSIGTARNLGWKKTKKTK